MIMTYQQCIKIYHSDYLLKKRLVDKELFKVEKGIYSNTKNFSRLEVISAKYPKAIFTLDSACYYYSLTDVVPDQYHVMTSKDGAKMKEKDIKQYFMLEDYLMKGVETLDINGISIKIYSKERLLVEILRYKNKLPYDYYKEIIGHYRRIITQLDIETIQEYAMMLPKSQMVMEILQSEVF